MSWLYKALLRSRPEHPKLGKTSEASISSPYGDSFLAGIESLYSPSTSGSGSRPEATSFAPLSTIKDIAKPPSKLRRQITISNTLKPPEAVTVLHGFRRATLPPQEDSRLVFRTAPHGLAAEQFRLLRRTLTQEFESGAVLMVTSPGVGDGKTLTTLNLCSCLAESGDSTLLVEADVRRPTAGKVLGCTMEAPGIEDAFAGKIEPGQAVLLIEELSLHAAVVTRIPNNPSHLIKGAGVERFLTWGRKHFRWVVLDAAPVLPAADVAELLPFADAILLVIRAHSTPRELSRRACDALGRQLHAVIFNDATIDSNPHYRYLGNYYQGSSKKSR